MLLSSKTCESAILIDLDHDAARETSENWFAIMKSRAEQMKIGIRSPMAIIALTTISAWSGEAAAAPQQLDCVLTDTEAHPQSENRPIVVVFDQDKRTLTAQEGGRAYSFMKVSISNVSMNGQAGSVSLGIDRSSLGIVWQQYEADKVHTEYGHCRAVRAPT
jgi:hypothetical protein